MFMLQSKITAHMKSQENMIFKILLILFFLTWFILKRQSTETNPKMTQMLELADKDFLTMLKDIKESKLVTKDRPSQ